MPLARTLYQILAVLLKVETISCFSQSRHLWLSYVVRLVEGTITNVCEWFEILYTSYHMDKR